MWPIQNKHYRANAYLLQSCYLSEEIPWKTTLRRSLKGHPYVTGLQIIYELRNLIIDTWNPSFSCPSTNPDWGGGSYDPKKKPRTDCVFLLLSRVNYCIPLPSLWEKGRKWRQLLRRTLRLSLAKMREKPMLGQRKAIWLYQRNHVPLHHGLWCLAFPFYDFPFSFLFPWISRFCLSERWRNVLSSHQ